MDAVLQAIKGIVPTESQGKQSCLFKKPNVGDYGGGLV